jgi:hypothetical protein
MGTIDYFDRAQAWRVKETRKLFDIVVSAFNRLSS